MPKVEEERREDIGSDDAFARTPDRLRRMIQEDEKVVTRSLIQLMP